MWKLPVIGWFLSLTAAISMSIPFWICWTACGIGKTYFYWLPRVYLSISFWECVGLFVTLNIIGSLVRYVTPHFVSVTQSNTNGEKKGWPSPLQPFA